MKNLTKVVARIDEAQALQTLTHIHNALVNRVLDRDSAIARMEKRTIECGLKYLEQNPGTFQDVIRNLVDITRLGKKLDSVAGQNKEAEELYHRIVDKARAIESVLSFAVSARLCDAFTLSGTDRVGANTVQARTINAGATGLFNYAESIHKLTTRIDTVLDVVLSDEQLLKALIEQMEYESDRCEVEEENFNASSISVKDAEEAEKAMQAFLVSLFGDDKATPEGLFYAAPQAEKQFVNKKGCIK
ncbi:MAG: hypothetical protein RBU23_04015 [Candidatus Auribacterota bacterium]|jgi:hypothetical protein|nr:hypothetical protein [Candidatus Auribacterota bacterium]